jgi:hypothetical protein
MMTCTMRVCDCVLNVSVVLSLFLPLPPPLFFSVSVSVSVFWMSRRCNEILEEKVYDAYMH